MKTPKHLLNKKIIYSDERWINWWKIWNKFNLNNIIMSRINYISFRKRPSTLTFIEKNKYWDFDEISIDKYENIMRRINDNFFEDQTN
jgi:hypothetical protein